MNNYRNFSYSADTNFEDFYSYFSLQDLICKATQDNEIMLRCRTIGVLESLYGRFYISDLECPIGSSGPAIQMSVLYLKSPLPSTVKPYPVQVFGTLQWKNRPVIFAKTLQVLNISNAIRVRNAMKSIAERHKIDPRV